MSSQLSLGDLIQRQRAALGLTQARLAELVGRSPSAVRSWERDRGVPGDQAAMAALTAVLGLTNEEVQNAIGDQEGAAADEAVGPAFIPLIDAPLDEPTRSPLPPKRTELFPRREPVAHDSRPLPADLPFDEEEPEPSFAELTDEQEPSVDRVDSPTVTEPVVGPDSGDSLETVHPQQPEPSVDRVDSPTVTEPVVGPDSGDSLETVHPQQPEPSVDRVDSPTVTDPVVGVGVPEPPASARPQTPAPGDEQLGLETVVDPVVSAARPASRPPTDRASSAVSLRSRPTSYLDDPEELRTYRTRIILTAVLLVFMFIVLTWAVGEARDAFGLIFDEPAL
ncbi:MAG: helix-turn-helix domain-containing protein [Acidimicrobiia bacterium]|nr:helix-turn-helix domain-containing protein [Acidimicrobiia bacterium]